MLCLQTIHQVPPLGLSSHPLSFHLPPSPPPPPPPLPSPSLPSLAVPCVRVPCLLHAGGSVCGHTATRHPGHLLCQSPEAYVCSSAMQIVSIASIIPVITLRLHPHSHSLNLPSSPSPLPSHSYPHSHTHYLNLPPSLSPSLPPSLSPSLSSSLHSPSGVTDRTMQEDCMQRGARAG